MNALSCPPGLTQPNAGAVSAYLREVLNLSTAELIAVGIQLEATLGAGTLNASDQYIVPSDRDLVIFQVQSTWRSSLISTEPVLNANLTIGVKDLERARLQNCIAQLRIKDRNLDVFDNGEVVMSAISDSPMYFPQVAPLLIPAAVKLQAIFTLQSAVAAVAGNDANYGLLLTGVAIPKRV